VKASLANVGWRGIVLDEAKRTVFLSKPGMRIGLGAIAPGYAGDRAIERIRARGIRDACVNMSGDVIAIGTKNGDPWRIAVKHPRKPGESVALLPISNGAASTSGDYERYFEADGRRYCHIIDPRTGVPANLCQSVTVTAPVLAVADGLATGIFVLGPRKGLELVERLDGVEAIIVDAEGVVHHSRGLH
jgi:thiamine biosynthesis lipoprotein